MRDWSVMNLGIFQKDLKMGLLDAYPWTLQSSSLELVCSLLTMRMGVPIYQQPAQIHFLTALTMGNRLIRLLIWAIWD